MKQPSIRICHLDKVHRWPDDNELQRFAWKPIKDKYFYRIQPQAGGKKDLCMPVLSEQAEQSQNEHR